MSEVPRFNPDEHPEFTVARILGDDLPSAGEFANDFSEGQLHDSDTRIAEKLIKLDEEIERLLSERLRMTRARQLVAESLPLARERGIE